MSLIISDEDIVHLLKGTEKFRAQYFSKDKANALYEKLVAEGQSPKTMVIACSDSRVDPSIILESQPGELFIVRNVANLVPPYDNDPKHHGTSAALEFAVQTLQVSNIIILGHSHCGGIRALLASSPKPYTTEAHSFIDSWMKIAEVAKAITLSECSHSDISEKEKMCEEQSLRISLKNLMTFPWIHERVAKGELHLYAWRFDLISGKIQCFNSASQQFEDLAYVKD